MDRNTIIEECALRLEEMAEAAECSQARANTSAERERYSERNMALLDGAVSLRNLKE